MTVSHGYRIVLCDGDISVSGCDSPEVAKARAEDFARRSGYRPPPRWKFWDQDRWVRVRHPSRIGAADGDGGVSKSRSEIDFAVEFGRYLADAAEQFMAEQNRAAFVGEDPDPDYWRSLASAIYEFRKRADRADAVTNLFRRLGANQRRRSG